MTIVQTHNLCKSYKYVNTLKDVNLQINKGDIYGLIGRNGAGKTTLMRIICGLTLPTKGYYSLFGESEPEKILQNRTRVSAIIKSPALYKNFTARENLQIMALLKGIEKTKIDEMLDFAGLGGSALREKVKNFSLGMCQRLALAMAFINDPEFLILDEPVNGLDPQGIKEVREVLRRINKEKGVTILISSHILSELGQLATKYGIIDKGVMVEEVSAKELENKLNKTLDIIIFSKEDLPKAEKILKEQYNVNNYIIEGDTIVIKNEAAIDNVQEINMALAKAGIMVRGVNIKSADLEQYFLENTGGKIW